MNRTNSINRSIAWTGLTAGSRLIILAFDIAFLVVAAGVIALVTAVPAYAYVDPSVMTYTIQALAGVAVAIGAVAGVAFRRSRKWLFAKLKIDENANKEVETDVIRCDGAGYDAMQAVEAEKPGAGEIESDKKTPTFKTRLLWAAVASFFVVFTILLVAPCEIIMANRDSFIFSLRDCWPPIALFALTVWVALTLLVSLLKGRPFRIAILALFVIGFGSYIQAFFFNSDLPVANGAFFNLFDYKTITAESTAAWLAIAALVIIGYKKAPRLAPRIICVLALALVVMQSVGVGSLMLDENAGKAAADSDEVFTTEVGLFDLSPKENIVVFVLDMFDVDNMDEVLTIDPHALDEFTDFTYYHNSTAVITPTRLAVPYLLTGKSLGEYDDYYEYLDKRFEDSHLMEDVYDAGYSIGLYTNDLWQGRDKFKDIAINLGSLDRSAINNWGVITVAWKTAMYRDMPWLLKPFFWFSTDELNETMADRETFNESCTPYVLDDALYFRRMKEKPLTLTDKGDKGAFRFIHLQGAHYPYTIDENGELSRLSDKIPQCRGTLKIVSEYLRQMKEAGVYNDATIIVTADHGYWTGATGLLHRPAAPILLVHQPAGDNPENAPYKVSNAPTGHQDYPASIVAAAGGDYSEYGHTIWETEGGKRIRYYFMCLYTDDTYPIANIEYEIKGDVNDFRNWKPTGRIYPYSDDYESLDNAVIF